MPQSHVKEPNVLIQDTDDGQMDDLHSSTSEEIKQHNNFKKEEHTTTPATAAERKPKRKTNNKRVESQKCPSQEQQPSVRQDTSPEVICSLLSYAPAGNNTDDERTVENVLVFKILVMLAFPVNKLESNFLGRGGTSKVPPLISTSTN